MGRGLGDKEGGRGGRGERWSQLPNNNKIRQGPNLVPAFPAPCQPTSWQSGFVLPSHSNHQATSFAFPCHPFPECKPCSLIFGPVLQPTGGATSGGPVHDPIIGSLGSCAGVVQPHIPKLLHQQLSCGPNTWDPAAGDSFRSHNPPRAGGFLLVGGGGGGGFGRPLEPPRLE